MKNVFWVILCFVSFILGGLYGKAVFENAKEKAISTAEDTLDTLKDGKDEAMDSIKAKIK